MASITLIALHTTASSFLFPSLPPYTHVLWNRDYILFLVWKASCTLCMLPESWKIIIIRQQLFFLILISLVQVICMKGNA